MDNINNIEMLAQTAMASNNYQQAYEYYSKLLENNTSNRNYWIGKGISSGWLSTPDVPKFNEMKICILNADKIEALNNDEKFKISNDIIKICENKIQEILLHIEDQINKEFDRKPMGTGTLYAVQQTAKIPINLKYGRIYSRVLCNALEVMRFANDLYSYESHLKSMLDIINQINRHSRDRNDYLQLNFEEYYNGRGLDSVRDDIEGRIKSLNPNADTSDKTSSGCFIATATTGDINHPDVKQLRLFRDTILSHYEIGVKFIDKYYLISPPIAKRIESDYLLKKMVFIFFIKPLSMFTKLFTENK